MTMGDGKCECCLQKRELIGVASIPGLPMSIAWCEECLTTDCLPYWVVVFQFHNLCNSNDDKPKMPQLCHFTWKDGKKLTWAQALTGLNHDPKFFEQSEPLKEHDNKGETYECARCGKTFEKGQSDEDAEEELKDVFNTSKEECVLICDDCDKELKKLISQDLSKSQIPQ